MLPVAQYLNSIVSLIFVQFSSCLRQEGKSSPNYSTMARSLDPNFILFCPSILSYHLVLSIFHHIKSLLYYKDYKRRADSFFLIYQPLFPLHFIAKLFESGLYILASQKCCL